MVLLLLVSTSEALAASRVPIVYSVLETDSPLEPGEYLWEPQRAPSGRLEIVADLARDTLYVYRGGVEIGRTILIYGADHKPTPLGSFPILQKNARHISNLYGAPMPYMMRLTWGGISIHGSGEFVENRWATHGCIGLPDEFAALLFKVARVGDRVTVTRNWLPQAYS
ncbi:MAG: L,D-transpeptidase family protein [Sphingomonas sp.]|nr:L,D-transpeptidase family protein [Sphingomonas sp.]